MMKRTIILGILALLLASSAYAVPTVETGFPSIRVNYQGDSSTEVPDEVQITRAEFVGNETTVEGEVDPSGYNNSFLITPDEALSNGNYSLIVNASDRVSNSREDVFNFTIDIPFTITLVEPTFGYTNESNYTIVLNTSIPSHCSWWSSEPDNFIKESAFDGEDENTYNSEHFMENQSFDGESKWFICVNKEGEKAKEEFSFVIDDTEPLITASAHPNPVVDPSKRNTELTVETDDETVCWRNGTRMGEGDLNSASSYKTIHKERISYDRIQDTKPHFFTYNLSCLNKAELPSWKNHSVLVNQTSSFDMEITNPPYYVSDSSVTLGVKTSITTGCEYEYNKTLKGSFGESSTRHSKNLGKLGEGEYAFEITCSARESKKAVAEFVVDQTPPYSVNIKGQKDSCSVEKLQVDFNAEDNTSGVSYFNYSIEGPEGKLVNWTKTSSKRASSNIELKTGQDYTWKMTAYDKAGNSRPASSFTMTSHNRSYERCDDVKPKINIETIDSPKQGGMDVKVTCSDLHSGCVSNINYSVMVSNEPCIRQKDSMSNGESLFVEYGNKICAWAKDKNGNTKFAEKDMVGKTVPVDCGNGRINRGELCDANDLGGKTCQDFGNFERGKLKCDQYCEFDTSTCFRSGTPQEPECGDGKVTSREHCEDNPRLTCSDLKGFKGGEISCTECRLDVSSCVPANDLYTTSSDEEADNDKEGEETIDTKESKGSSCGNGQIDSGEECDGNNLGGVTWCDEIGMTGGRLSCASDCTYDESACRETEQEFTPEEDSTSILALVLLILGLLSMMSGGGYLGYKKYYGPGTGPRIRKKPEETPSKKQTQKVKKPEPKPEPKEPSVDQVRETEKKKLLEEERREKRKEEREELFDEFDE